LFSCWLCFSSRRRHTSSKRDWSSDVCSSDLPGLVPAVPQEGSEGAVVHLLLGYIAGKLEHHRLVGGVVSQKQERVFPSVPDLGRSEERRVGKGGRSAGTAVGVGRTVRDREAH